MGPLRSQGAVIGGLRLALLLATCIAVWGSPQAADAQQPTPLTNASPVTRVVPQGYFADFTFFVPSGTTDLTASTTNATGDVDLFVRFGLLPELTAFDCRSSSGPTGISTCQISNPLPGLWFISVLGVAPGTHTFTLTARVQPAPPPPTTTTTTSTTTTTLPPQQGASAFVTRLYQQVLNRAPDQAGLQAFVAQILQDRSVVPTVLAFFHSQEFLSRSTSDEQFLTILYRTFLGRDPDPPGFNAFLADLQGGCRTRDNLLDIFIDSQEFRSQASFLPLLDPITAFVTNLYVRILGRGPDQPGLQFFVAQLQQTRTVLPTVQQFLASSEFVARNTTDTEFVTVLYRVFLNRVPDCPGLADWVTRLKNGTVTRDQLVLQFAASPEFQAIRQQLFPLNVGCLTIFAPGTPITLRAMPSSGASFGGWGDDCAGFGTSSTCTLSVTSAKTVTAKFVSRPLGLVSAVTPRPLQGGSEIGPVRPPSPNLPLPVPMEVFLVGDGSGTVRSDLDGINCTVGTAVTQRMVWPMVMVGPLQNVHQALARFIERVVWPMVPMVILGTLVAVFLIGAVQLRRNKA